MKALILAAGEGTRLGSLTRRMPKPMLPVSGRPVLEYIVRWLACYGIDEIAVNLFHAPDAVVGYFGDGKRFGVRITYSHEPRLLGTAGALRPLAHFLNEPFLLVYGDVLTDFALAALIEHHFACGASMTLSLVRRPPAGCGIAELDASGRLRRFLEKPAEHERFSNLTNAGVLVMAPELIGEVPDTAASDVGRDLIPRLLAAAVPLFGWILPPESYLIDIGTPEAYARAQREWPTPAARRFLEQRGARP
jgi:NDP-sugar pyrophosphorylase family protein